MEGAVKLTRRTKLHDAFTSRHALPYWLMAPTVIWVLFFVIYPLIFSIVMSFKEFVLKKGLTIWDMPWVGGRNFVDAVLDGSFHTALLNTIEILVIAVGAEFFAGLGIAILLNNKHAKGDFVYMALILTPMMMPMIAGGLVWRMLINTKWGAINAFIGFLGGPPVNFIGSSKLSLLTIMIVDFWQWTPFVVLILLAGLRALPHETYEAARVDGATHWQTFKHITWPLLAWPIMVVLLIRCMDAFKVFDTVYSITFGGPGNSSTTASFYIYRQGFTQFKLGYAAALSWIVFIIVYAISVLLIFFFRPREESA
jgi:multiple sugar transport system permease protein